MPWNAMIAAVAQDNFIALFNTQQTDLNLFTFFGSPAAPSSVDIIVDGVDIRTLIIGPWAAGTVINITLLNSARILGRGGNGGKGGDVVSTGGGSGTNNIPQSPTIGQAGGRAINASATTAVLNINGDDGYIWGGGGGGGGGGSAGRNTGGQGSRRGGGGGGGGQGWNNAPGGLGGDVWNWDSPDGSPGQAGSVAVEGLGGQSGMPGIPPGGNTTDATGGNGGSWGTAGSAGENATDTTGGGPWTATRPGAAGGAAGEAIFSIGTVNFVGSLDEAALVAADRLIGAVVP